jgi:hypothetical protein
MFDKKYLMDGLRPVYTHMTEDELEAYVDKIGEREKFVKRGDNVVHLEYYSPLINETDVSEIEAILSKSNLELSRRDRSGVMMASVEDFTLQMFIILNDKTTQEILLGLGTSALWDTIKSTTIYVWNKVKGKTINKITSREVTKKNINFGLRIKIDKETQIDFKLDGDVSEELISQSIDKIPDIIKNIKSGSVILPSIYKVYNKKTKRWNTVNIEKEIKKIIKKKQG